VAVVEYMRGMRVSDDDDDDEDEDNSNYNSSNNSSDNDGDDYEEIIDDDVDDVDDVDDDDDTHRYVTLNMTTSDPAPVLDTSRNGVYRFGNISRKVNQVIRDTNLECRFQVFKKLLGFCE